MRPSPVLAVTAERARKCERNRTAGDRLPVRKANGKRSLTSRSPHADAVSKPVSRSANPRNKADQATNQTRWGFVRAEFAVSRS